MIKFLRSRPGNLKTLFLRRKFWVVLVTLVILTHFAAKSDFIKRTGLVGLDAMQGLVRLKPANSTRIVKITRDTLDSSFKQMAPYHNPEKVMEAIDCIALHQPAVIAVDLLTDTPQYQNVKPKTDIPIVWAYAVNPKTGQPIQALGKSINSRYGAAMMVGDRDIMLRRYSRQVIESTTGTRFDSFPWAIVKTYCNMAKACPDHTNCENLQSSEMNESRILSNHSGLGDDDLTVFPLEDLLAGCQDWNARRQVKNASSADSFSPNIELKNKIVILGPYYGDDLICTPRGRWRGARVIADVIESELDKRKGIREMPYIMEWGFDILLAILIALLHHYLRPRPACLAILALMTFAVFGARIAFTWGGYWANFVVLILGIWIEQLYELSSVAERYASQIEETRSGELIR
jgi:CHASE2 domain-containing sensor protein